MGWSFKSRIKFWTFGKNNVFCFEIIKGANSFQTDLLKPLFGGFKKDFSIFPTLKILIGERPLYRSFRISILGGFKFNSCFFCFPIYQIPLIGPRKRPPYTGGHEKSSPPRQPWMQLNYEPRMRSRNSTFWAYKMGPYELIVIDGVTVRAPINGRKYMGFPRGYFLTPSGVNLEDHPSEL